MAGVVGDDARPACGRRTGPGRSDRTPPPDNDFGFERHFIRSHAAMKTRVGLALAIMMALALGHVREGRRGQMRSLVAEVPFLDTGLPPPGWLHPPESTRGRP